MSRKKLTVDKNNFDLSILGDRLLYAIKLMDTNQKKFAEKAELLPATINGIIKSGKSPTAETLTKIHRAGINMLWLVMDEGDMFVHPVGTTIPMEYTEKDADGQPQQENVVRDDLEVYNRSSLNHVINLLRNTDQIPPQKQKAIFDLIRSILELVT